jgi:hypothetical protein
MDRWAHTKWYVGGRSTDRQVDQLIGPEFGCSIGQVHEQIIQIRYCSTFSMTRQPDSQSGVGIPKIHSTSECVWHKISWYAFLGGCNLKSRVTPLEINLRSDCQTNVDSPF